MSSKTNNHILIVWESSGDEIHLAVLESWRLKEIEELIDSYLIERIVNNHHDVVDRLIGLVHENTIIGYECQSYIIENSEELSKFNIEKIIHLPPMAF